MKADYIRAGVTARLLEARVLSEIIKPKEGVFATEASQALEVSAIRGLIYICLYGTLEYCVTQGVQAYLGFTSATKVQQAHIEYAFNSVALDGHLNTLQNPTRKNKWPARRAIFEKLAENSICDVPDTAFGTFLHNIYPSSIKEIFLCFGIEKPPTSSPSSIGYIKEITEKRNAVAHGRDTATDAGEGLTQVDIETRMRIIYNECLYFLSTLEEHAQELRFIRPRFRRNYRTAA